ncbi:MAG: transcriptional regulator, partial [Methanobacteriales archaeon Met13]
DYVLDGEMKLYIHENEIILKKGDSIFFDSSYEHAMEALNNQPTIFLAVIL